MAPGGEGLQILKIKAEENGSQCWMGLGRESFDKKVKKDEFAAQQIIRRKIMIEISLCMIVRNEENVLGRCLQCAQSFADEIIVVDTGSTDGTKAIAENFTKKVFDFPWTDDFAAARNYSFSKATRDYIMWLDADDVVRPEDQEKILQLKKDLDPSVDVVMMKYLAGFDELGNPTFVYDRERLLRRAAQPVWEGAIHEVITPFGNILKTDIAVCHKKIKPGDPDRNLRIFEKMIKDGKTLSPREKFYYGRELMYHGRYDEAGHIFRDFLEEGQGWIENKIEACLNLAYCLDALGKKDSALQSLFSSFHYAAPRAEICCEIGRIFLSREQYSLAVFWYEQALRCRPEENQGFLKQDCYRFIPYMQLCVCYDRMGDTARAKEYNEKAGALKPQHPAYLYNVRYFSSR